MAGWAVWLAAMALGAETTDVRMPSLGSPGPEVAPGTRVRLFVTYGPAGARVTTTVLAGCAEVRAVDADAITVAADVGQGDELRKLPAGATITPALCPSDASPLSRAIPEGHVALPFPDEVPDRFLATLRAGDRVDVVVTLPDRPEGVAETFTMLKDVAVAADRGAALVVPGDAAEKYAHALQLGTTRLSLHGESTDPRAPPDGLASIIPAGFRVMGAFEDRFGAFVDAAGYVDVLVSLPGRTTPVLQAVFVANLGAERATGAGVVGVIVTPEQAEHWTHLCNTLPYVLALRPPGDDDLTNFDAAPDPEPAPVAAEEPTARIALGMRGIVLPAPPGTREGGRVNVTAQAGERRPRVIVDGRVVLAVGQAPDGTALALVHVTPPEAIAITAAVGEGRTVGIR